MRFVLCTSFFWFLCWKLECKFLFYCGSLAFFLLSCSVGLWNAQASIYNSSVEEISIHQYASFLETCLLPLLHRSTTLLNPTKGTQTLHRDIASRGWARPVQDTSLLWQSRQIQHSPKSTNTEADEFPQTKVVLTTVFSFPRCANKCPQRELKTSWGMRVIEKALLSILRRWSQNPKRRRNELLCIAFNQKYLNM